MIQIQCTRRALMLMLVQYTNRRWGLWTNINISTSALDLNHFSSNKTYACIDLIHTWHKNKIIYSYLWKIINKMAFQMPLNTKNINNLPSEKMDQSMWQSHVWSRNKSTSHSGAARGVQWTFSIHFTYKFTKEPIRKQETKLGVCRDNNISNEKAMRN